MIANSKTSFYKQSSLVDALHVTVKGRARYKVKGLQGSKALKSYLECWLAQKQGIEAVSANINSGNILVKFRSHWSWKTVASAIANLIVDYRKQRKNGCPTVGKMLPSRKVDPESSIEEQQTETWHLMEAETAIARWQTSATVGLSEQLVRVRRDRYGLNLLPEAAPRSKLSILLEQFKSLPVGLLSIAAGLSALTGGLADAAVIMGVVAINAAIGYATESQSERIIHSLKHLVKPSAYVIRDRKLQEISSEEIVLGDLLVLKPGSYVAADARVIESRHLSVDESALTGESMPVVKTAEALTVADIPLGDRINMVYMGTLVTGGQGIAVVVATGKFTEMGRIQSLVGAATMPATPMEKQLDRAGSQLVLFSSAVCGVIFAIGLLRGYNSLQMLKTSISLAVAAVPEGLPAVATTTLALGIQQMRRHKVLIRRLEAIEALGSVQSICLDKTGTLTANKMAVVEIYADSQRLQVNGRDAIDPYSNDRLLKLLHVLVLCNESQLDGDSEVEYSFKGSSTENALLELALNLGVDVRQVREKYPLKLIQHRSEDRNVMRSLHETVREKKLIAIKGSPTEVLALCGWHGEDSQVLPLTEADRVGIEMENDRMAGKALRVLGVAYGYTDDLNRWDERDNLVWLGLVGMADPIRDGVKEAIESLHQAGIDTIMITGDQSPTAYAIGKELNLSQGKQLETLDSTHLEHLDPEVLKALSDRVRIFARISPAHKLQVVQALQSAGKIVAMTGDGINDAPALKAAEIGIAMGNGGTDVAREVADVVLEDDDLQTTVVAVSCGRTIYSNIRKSVHFLLSTNLSEILVMFSANAIGIGQPLNAMQLLWLNLVTDIFPGLALALEPAELDVLKRPPRDPNEPIISVAEFKRIAFESTALSVSSLAAYGYGISRYGISPQASTIAFMSLTIGQLLHSLSCRSRTHRLFSPYQLPPNRYLTLALGGSLTLQLLSAVIPGLRGLLQIAPIGLLDGTVIASSALVPLLINEGTKSPKPLQRL
jgi:Ca2+-transporting ATPase